ncbi:hypothetical protein GCM10027605_40260 [Micromonospora zhanjiangensis]
MATILSEDPAQLWPDRRRDATWFRPWREIEAEALALRSFQPLVIPGLLQTPEYARVVLTEAGLVRRSDVPNHVNGRMARRAILAREEPPSLTAVVDEFALRRPVGGAAVMRAQLNYLVNTAAALPNVRIHVVPTAAGAYAGLNGAFVLADLPGSRVMAYLDTPLAGEVVDDSDRVTDVLHAWESCRGEALPHRQSIELIRELAEAWN